MARAIEYGQLHDLTVCMLGCGNLGSAILDNIVTPSSRNQAKLPIKNFRICVRSEETQKKLLDQYQSESSTVSVSRGKNAAEVEKSDVIMLAVDPSDVAAVLKPHAMRQALCSNATDGRNKILISVVAGWTKEDLEKEAFGDPFPKSTSSQAWIVRTLPNVGASVAQALTAIEVSEPSPPDWVMEITDALFSRIGTTVHIPPKLMDATTAVGGSTPAFWAVICDAFIDASVAVGVPRPLAQKMIFQSMLGTATMMQRGLHPALLRDQGTSPEGCTIGGLMVMEEGAVRGVLGKALRQAVTVAREMGRNPHPNDTR